MRKQFYCLLAVLLSAIQLTAQENLFPKPLSYVGKEGVFTVCRDVKVKGNVGYARELAEKFHQEALTSVWSGDSVSGKISFVLHSGKKSTPESYTIDVEPDRIRVEAADSAGLFYAYETLRQLVSSGAGKIRCCEIQDKPRFSWRGYMLDESRHFFGKEKVKQYLDIMASLHLNVFHWHLTDGQGWRIEIKRYPELSTEAAKGNCHDHDAPARFYTQDELREIVAYAAERHITIIPEIDMPGHSTAVCRTFPEIAVWNGRYCTLNPCIEETYTFINNVFDEVFDIFPAPYIHVGGDEVRYSVWAENEEIQNYMKKHGIADEKALGCQFTKRIAAMVKSKGKKIIAWDDAIGADVSPQDMLVMYWRHDKPDHMQKALEKGYDVVMCPRLPMYADFIQHESHRVGRIWRKVGFNSLDSVYAFPKSLESLMEGHESQILGLQMNLWTENVPDSERIDFMTFPRLIATAEAAWTADKNKDYDHFLGRLPDYLKYLDKLGIYYFNPFDPSSTPEPTDFR